MARTKKQIITAVATFSIALGIGTAMQYGEALASRWGADAPVMGPGTRLDADTLVIPVAANMAVPMVLATPSKPAATSHKTISVPAVPDVLPVAFEDISVPEMVAPSANDPVVAMPAPEEKLADDMIQTAAVDTALIDEVAPPMEPVCETTMTATPGDLALVRLDIANSCRPNETISIHHQGMMFDTITDDFGRVSVDVPALRQEAFFIAAYEDGDGAVAITGVPSLAQYDRAVLQWQGEEGVQLHALEFGADYGTEGHVWAGVEVSPEAAFTGTGGFLTRLGNPAVPTALMAEVYTFPSGLVTQDGAVALSVEAEITARNCGRDIAAQSLQVMSDEEIRAIDLTMTMPGCDAVGEFLVLKNMFEDLKLASK